MDIAIRISDQPDPDTNTFISDQLTQFNLQHVAGDQHRRLFLYAYDDQGAVAGGLLGGTYWGWLEIKILWVRVDQRGQGLGRRLVQAAEQEALRRGCKHAHVDTMDFQAPDFYQKLGYTVWGVLDDLPEGHRRIFFRKRLAAEGAGA